MGVVGFGQRGGRFNRQVMRDDSHPCLITDNQLIFFFVLSVTAIIREKEGGGGAACNTHTCRLRSMWVQITRLNFNMCMCLCVCPAWPYTQCHNRNLSELIKCTKSVTGSIRGCQLLLYCTLIGNGPCSLKKKNTDLFKWINLIINIKFSFPNTLESNIIKRK